MFCRNFLFFLFFIGTSLLTTAFGQSLVTGLVTDEAGTPLPGVSVVVDGTTQAFLPTLTEIIPSTLKAPMPFYHFPILALLRKK